MALTNGSRVGAYEIMLPLGAGGMGEVYLARDTRLCRDVALKILPASFAADPDRLARFEREAQLLASLSHPNIGAIHGIEDAGPVRALVLELVDGPTLADRLDGHALPIGEALQIARQIGAALEAAHDKGIVHRDLKPANVKVRADGTVKVLDFGLAKLVEAGGAGGAREAGGAGAVSMSPTMLGPGTMTGVGVILGTAAYMSPEQARGRPVDRRADIWAYGCVLYEMLTGRAAFGGDSVGDIVSEVLKSEPDWQRLPADTPAAVRRLLRRCLEKDPARRLRDVGDARLELDAQPEPSMDAPPSRTPMLIGAAVLVTALAAAAAVVWRTDPAPGPALVKRFQLPAPAGADIVRDVAISPNGRDLAIVGSAGPRDAIWLRSFGSAEARLLAGGLDGPRAPFWSPDGRSLAFFEGGQLKIVTVATGDVRSVCPAPDGLGGSWGADDTIIFTPAASGGIFRVDPRGGPVTAVTSPDAARGETSHRWARLLPDGRRFLFMGWSPRRTAGDTKYSVQIASLDGGPPRVLAEAASAAVYDPAGYLLFVTDTPRRLIALPFDVQRAVVTGTPRNVEEGLVIDWIGGRLPLTVGPDGTMVFLTETEHYSHPTVFDRRGAEQGTVAEPGLYFDPVFSPDGRSLLVEKSDPGNGAGDLWRIEVATGAARRLTHEPTFDNVPVWSADGERIAFSSDVDGLSHLFVTDAAASSPPVSLFAPENTLAYASDWSPDGTELLVTVLDQQRNADVWVVPGGGGAARPVLQSRYEERHARFSPDGRWIAYASSESGDSEVYIRSWPGLASPRQISLRGGSQPQWRADGRELFYAAPDGGIMSAAVRLGAGTMEVGTPTPLFNRGMTTGGMRNAYAASPDGQRFLVLTPIGDRRSAPMTVLVNWTALVTRPD